MKILRKIVFVFLATAAFAFFAGCATTSNTAQNANAVSTETAISSSKLKGDEEIAVDWYGKSLGNPEMPQWLAQAVAYNDFGPLKEALNGNDDRYYFVSAREGARTQDEGRVLAQVGAAQKLANEFRQTVISRAGQSLEKGDAIAVETVAVEAKVEISGNREELRFWKKVRTLNGMTGKVSESYKFYIVYSMDNEIYDAILKKYLVDIIGNEALTNREKAKVEVGKLFSEMKADRDKSQKRKTEKETREWLEKQDEKRRAYNMEIEKLDAEIAKEGLKTDKNFDQKRDKDTLERIQYDQEQERLRKDAEKYLQ